MSKLYEITEKHKALAKLSEESEDMAQAVADTMEGMEGEFEEKAVSLVHVVNNMAGDALAIIDAIDRLTKRKKSIVNKQNSLLNYLKINMEALGKTSIKNPLFTITLASGRDKVQIDDEDKISTDYMNIKTSFSPMKKELLEALKNGDEIEGVSLVKSDKTLRIK